MPIGDPRNRLPHCWVCGDLAAPLDAAGWCDSCAASAVVDLLRAGLEGTENHA